MENNLQQLTRKLGSTLVELVLEARNQEFDQYILDLLGIDETSANDLLGIDPNVPTSVFEYFKSEYKTDPLLNLDLSPSQRIIGHIMSYGDQNGKITWSQRELRELTGFTNKGIRTMLEDMSDKGYIRRGLKAATWESGFTFEFGIEDYDNGKN